MRIAYHPLKKVIRADYTMSSLARAYPSTSSAKSTPSTSPASKTRGGGRRTRQVARAKLAAATAAQSRAQLRTARMGSGQGVRWGRVTDLYDSSDYGFGGALDKGDPNYDSEDERSGGYVMIGSDLSSEADVYGASYNTQKGGGHSPPRAEYKIPRPTGRGTGTGTRAKVDSSLSSTSAIATTAVSTANIDVPSLPQYKKRIIAVLQEYFVSGDYHEVERCLREMWVPEFHYEFVKRTITMAMDRNARGCEAASYLISFLFGRRMLITDEIGKGFERLFEVIDDLKVDVPNAERVLAQFVARAVVDEVLPPVFLTDPTVVSLGGPIVQQAVNMLSVKHGQARVNNVWGPGASQFAEDLKRVIKLILAEFLDTHDCAEAALSIRLLEAPRYHHEIVKRAIVLAVDRGEADQVQVSTLFAYLHKIGLISTDQLVTGFLRVNESLTDLALDAPGAPKAFLGFVERAQECGALPNGVFS